MRACEVCLASRYLYQNVARDWRTSSTELGEKVQGLNCLDTVHEYLLNLAIGDERQQAVVDTTRNKAFFGWKTYTYLYCV